MPCVHLYAYMEQNAVWCNMKARFSFMLIWKKLKKIFDIKIKNNLFLINSKLPGMSNCIHVHIYSFVTLTFLNFIILTNKFT